mgnify:CR=1 FL=1
MVIIKLINNRYRLDELLYSNLYCSTYAAYDLSNNNNKIVINILNNDNLEKTFVNYLTESYIGITTIEHINIQKCLSFDVIDTIDTKNNLHMDH